MPITTMHNRETLLQTSQTKNLNCDDNTFSNEKKMTVTPGVERLFPDFSLVKYFSKQKINNFIGRPKISDTSWFTRTSCLRVRLQNYSNWPRVRLNTLHHCHSPLNTFHGFFCGASAREARRQISLTLDCTHHILHHIRLSLHGRHQTILQQLQPGCGVGVGVCLACLG